MGKKSRNKGASGEREVVKLFDGHLGVKLERNLQQAINGGFDLIADSDMVTAGLAIEVKRYASVTQGMIETWWQQAISQATGGRIPVLFFRADRQDWRVMIDGGKLTPALEGAESGVIMEPFAFFQLIREETLL